MPLAARCYGGVTRGCDREVAGVLRWAAVNARRTGVLIAGVVLCAAGAVLLLLPGPGLLVLAAGLAVLSIEFAWARRLLHRTREEVRRRAGRGDGSQPPDGGDVPPTGDRSQPPDGSGVPPATGV